jgi:predicted MFS family arabinose efflux permease
MTVAPTTEAPGPGSATRVRERVPAYIWTTFLPARTLLNAQFRIPYPFLPAISRGLGVPLEVASLLLTVRDLIGATSPAFGYLSDRIGRKTVMVGGLAAFVAGAALVAIGHTFGVALIAFALLGLAKCSYEPTMQAYVADEVPYERRGRALSITELSWSLAWLIGVPVAGFLITRWDWRAPFLVMAVLGLFSVLANARLKPPAAPPAPVTVSPAVAPTALAQSGQVPSRGARLTAALRPLAARRVWMMLAVSGLVILANELFFIIYGAWMETQFGLAPDALGVLSIVTSLAELTAAIFAAAALDRIGKRRGLLGGLALNACAYLVLRLLAGNLGTALGGIILLGLTSEFCIVATIPLISELVPRARGTVMATNTAVTALTAAVASIAAPRLWEAGRLSHVTAASAACIVLAWVLLWYARDRRKTT